MLKLVVIQSVYLVSQGKETIISLMLLKNFSAVFNELLTEFSIIFPWKLLQK